MNEYEPQQYDIVEHATIGLITISRPEADDEDEDALLGREDVLGQSLWNWDSFPGYRASGEVGHDDLIEGATTVWRPVFSR